jgi:hypothetical protein
MKRLWKKTAWTLVMLVALTFATANCAIVVHKWHKHPGPKGKPPWGYNDKRNHGQDKKGDHQNHGQDKK